MYLIVSIEADADFILVVDFIFISHINTIIAWQE